MKNPDIIITEMNGILRVTFNSKDAKVLSIDEPDFAPYITRKDNLVYMDLVKTKRNKTDMVEYCKEHNLTKVIEDER